MRGSRSRGSGRKLRRRLGPLRDLDVMLGHLGDLPAPHARRRRRVVVAAARAARDRARRNSTDQKPPSKVVARLDTWGPLRGEIAEAHEAVDSLLVESIHLQIDAFAEQAQRLTPVPEAPESGVDVHELRIAGKALRYTLEMAREQGRPLAGRAANVQAHAGALGLWHDFVVLTEWAMRVARRAAGAPRHAHEGEGVRAGPADAWARSGSSSGSADLWAREGAGLAETIRGSFPLTQAASVAAVGAGR